MAIAIYYSVWCRGYRDIRTANVDKAPRPRVEPKSLSVFSYQAKQRSYTLGLGLTVIPEKITVVPPISLDRSRVDSGGTAIFSSVIAVHEATAEGTAEYSVTVQLATALLEGFEATTALATEVTRPATVNLENPKGGNVYQQLEVLLIYKNANA